jgi:hypothetical protein
MSNKLMTLDNVMTLGQALANSKYFGDAKEASQAVVKVLAGQELGIGPVAAMSGLYIVKGKVSIGSNILASLVKASPKYDYKIVEHSTQTCAIEFFENGESIGVSEFTMEDAKQANLHGKDNWKQFPKNMLFSRALSNGAKWFAPDLFNGQAVYTPDEIETDNEPEPELIIENPPIDVDRQEWIETIIESGNFPADKSPVDKIKFINEQMGAEGLDFPPVTVPELLNG